MTLEKLDAAILVGGKSTRFGSDKALFEIDGKPMLHHIVENLRPFSDRIFLCGTANASRYGLSIESFEDLIVDAGPLGGLYTAAKTASTEPFFALPCDMPYVNGASLRELISCWKPGLEGVIFEDSSGQLYPLSGLFSKRVAAEILSLYQKGGGLSAVDFFDGLPHVSRIEPPQEALQNINYPPDNPA